MQELLTKKKLTLSLNSMSQVCTCRNTHSRKQCLDTCPANVTRGKNVGSLESTAAQQNIQIIEDAGIQIGNIVADGTHQVTSKLPKRIGKFECAVHLSRSARRRVYKVAPQLSKDCCSGPAQTKALADTIINRCKRELTLARKKYTTDDNFFKHMKNARGIILSCMAGNHIPCRGASLSCVYVGRRRVKYRLESQQKQWMITATDASLLQTAIDHKLNDEVLKKQINIQDTNKVEAFHLRCFKLNPKSKLNRTTYHARNLHAVSVDTK